MRKKLIGRRNFGPEIDITDPCYDKDIWCRMNSVKIKPGEYACRVWHSNEKYEWEGEMHDDIRVGTIGIYLDDFIPIQKSMEEIGTIGVDAGLAGFFENKPDYSEDEWTKFCNETWKNKKDSWIFEEGFFSSSGYGDGCYPVYAFKDVNGDIIALEIRFL